MHINCSTCLELLTPSDDLSVTPCGHLFHSDCILKWYASSEKTECPQCRTKRGSSQLRRVFLTEGVDNSLSEDPNVLQNKIDSLTFQVRCLEREKKKLLEERDSLTAKHAGLAEEVKARERKISELKATNSDIRSTLEFHKREKHLSDKAKSEAKEAKEKLVMYQNIDAIVKASEADVMRKLHEIGEFSQEAKQLAIIVTALKKELTCKKHDQQAIKSELQTNMHKNRELKASLKAKSEEVGKLQIVNRGLKSDLKHAEEEKQSLKTQIKYLQEAVESPSGDVKSSLLNRFLKENPLPICPDFAAATQSTEEDLSTPKPIKKEFEEEKDVKVMPSCSLKTTKRLLSSPCKDKTNNLSQFSIMKKSRVDLGQSTKLKKFSSFQDQFYNGLGGHSRLDSFPQPRLKQTESKKPKGIIKAKNQATVDKYFGGLDTP